MITGSAITATFAAKGEVVLSQRLAEAPRSPSARVAPRPHVLPPPTRRGEPVPYLVAVVDRTGADVSCVTGDGRRADSTYCLNG